MILDIQDFMITVEISIELNSHLNKNEVVRRVSRIQKGKYCSRVNNLLRVLSKARNSFELYTKFMDTVGL